MFYSNSNGETISLKESLTNDFFDSDTIRIAVGYVSTDTVQEFLPTFLSVADNGGLVQLLVGMAFFEGLNSRKKSVLENIDSHLRAINESNGVFVAYDRKYHGKIYCSIKDEDSSIYIGSNNFSQNSFKQNIESSLKVNEDAAKQRICDFLDYLFSSDISAHVNDATIPTTGVPARASATLSTVARPFTAAQISTSTFFDIDLAEVSKKEKSNLNVYFGKGRWSRSTGKVAPRPWYEIELINPIRVTRSAAYPKGNFSLFTSDGFEIKMTTNGDYYKNMRSLGGLEVFGIWLKGKLEKSNALIQYQPVTPETFEIYGKDVMRIYRISNGIYYTDF